MSGKYYLHAFIVALLLRVIQIEVPHLWYDENFTLILARLPFDRMIAATAADVHPPLWYVIEWIFVRLISDLPAWALRIPALVCSMLAWIVFAQLLEELNIPTNVKAIALILMTILPMQIWYAQEARMYALLELEVLLALLFALRSNWIGLFITSVEMLYTQNYAVIYLACIGLWITQGEIVFRRHMGFFSSVGPHIASAILVAFLAYLPWANVIAAQMTTISGRYWIQGNSIGDALHVIYKMFFTNAMPSFALISAMIVTFMAVCIGAWSLWRSHHPERIVIFIMAFGPLALAWIASLLWQPILLFRPLIGTAPFLYIVAAWSIDGLFTHEKKSWREAALAAAFVVPVLVAGLGGYYRNIFAMKNDGAVSPLADAFAYVKAHWQDGDVIYYTDDGPMINILPYAGDLPQYMIEACGERFNYGPVLGSLSPATRSAIGIQIAELSDIPHTRAWVFAPHSPLHPQCYEDHIAPITIGDPLIVVDDNQFISSGVWLVEKP